METQQGELQLGDFIKGRLLFLEDYCKRRGLDYPKTLAEVQAQALRLAGTPEKAEFLKTRLFSGIVLSSAYFPDWVDKVLLEAITIAFKGPGAPLHTTTSRIPCITFEAGQFNAHRQADTVFRAYFSGKRPEDWLKSGFVQINRKCYGDAFADHIQVEELGPRRFRVSIDNAGVEKADQMDCSTGVGYLYGALEKLGVTGPLVTHDRCGLVPGSPDRICVYEISWR